LRIGSTLIPDSISDSVIKRMFGLARARDRQEQTRTEKNNGSGWFAVTDMILVALDLKSLVQFASFAPRGGAKRRLEP